MEVPCPPIYFVVEYMTTAAPWSKGRQMSGAAVLSIDERDAVFAPDVGDPPRIGKTWSFGFGSVSA